VEIGVKWWDDLVNAVIDGFYGAEEAIDDTAGMDPAEQRELYEIAKEALNGTENPRKGVLKFSRAMEILEKHLLEIPGMIIMLQILEQEFRDARLSQKAKRAEVAGVKRRLGGAGWQGPRAERKEAVVRSGEEETAYRAEHRSRTGYPRGRPKKEDERREYPPKKPRGRPRQIV